MPRFLTSGKGRNVWTRQEITTSSSTKVADRIAEEIPSRNLLAVTYRDLPDSLPLWKIRHNGVGAIVCNPASLTYYGLSFSLTYYGLSPWDALDETETDLAIVHISNLHAREQWRRHDVR